VQSKSLLKTIFLVLLTILNPSLFLSLLIASLVNHDSLFSFLYFTLKIPVPMVFDQTE